MDKEINKKDYLEKLKKILPHWIEHNNEHIKEHKKWLKDAKLLGANKIVEDLEKIINLLNEANKNFESIKKNI